MGSLASVDKWQQSGYTRDVPVAQFGELVRQARLAQGIGLREVARQAGIEPSRLSRIELGLRPPPPLSEIRALAQVLGLSMADLLVAAGTPKEVVESLLWSGRLAFGGEEAFSPVHPELVRKNTFLARTVASQGALKHVRLGDETLQAISFSHADLLWLVIPPEAVVLSQARPAGLIGCNLIPGQVMKVRRLGDLVNVVLACRGFALNVLVGNPDGTPFAVGQGWWAAVPIPVVRTHPVKEGSL
jgi:transcriptional regulator with XRE-family HTH domain